MGNSFNVKAYRRKEIDICNAKDFEVGDVIFVGCNFATCMKITKKGYALFIFDDYLDEAYPMNADDTNEGGYQESDLRKWLQGQADDILGDLKNSVVPFKNGDLLRIPYAEELFGDIDWVEPSGKTQWELMKHRKNRIAERTGDPYEWGWLANKVKDSAAYFALVYTSGPAAYANASGSRGVRPVFRLG